MGELGRMGTKPCFDKKNSNQYLSWLGDCDWGNKKHPLNLSYEPRKLTGNELWRCERTMGALSHGCENWPEKKEIQVECYGLECVTGKPKTPLNLSYKPY